MFQVWTGFSDLPDIFSAGDVRRERERGRGEGGHEEYIAKGEELFLLPQGERDRQRDVNGGC